MRALSNKATKGYTTPSPNRPWLLKFSEEGAVCLLDRTHVLTGTLKLSRKDNRRYCVYDLDQKTYGEYSFFESLEEATKKFDAIANGTSFSVHS